MCYSSLIQIIQFVHQWEHWITSSSSSSSSVWDEKDIERPREGMIKNALVMLYLKTSCYCRTAFDLNTHTKSIHHMIYVINICITIDISDSENSSFSSFALSIFILWLLLYVGSFFFAFSTRKFWACIYWLLKYCLKTKQNKKNHQQQHQRRRRQHSFSTFWRFLSLSLFFLSNLLNRMATRFFRKK